jgi:hypothetical protein
MTPKKIIAWVFSFCFLFSLEKLCIEVTSQNKKRRQEQKANLRQILLYTKFQLSEIHKYFKLINKKVSYLV